MRKSKYLVLSPFYFKFKEDLSVIDEVKKLFNAQNILDLLRFNNISTIPAYLMISNALNFIYFPNSILDIYARAFGDAFNKYNTKYINFSNCTKLKKISMFAFSTNNINIIDLSNCKYLDKIDTSAFEQCNIKRIKIPNNIKELNPYAFYDNNINYIDLSNCTKLTDLSALLFTSNELKLIELPPNLKRISDNCFQHNLISYIDLYSCQKLNTICDNAFLNNPFKKIKIKENITIEYNSNFSEDIWNQFVKYYNETGKRAGDYKYEDDQWKWYPL